MRFSFVRLFQWLGVAVGLFLLVGLNYEFESDAGETVNAPVEDSLSQSLLGYWKMDEGTGTSTTADSSGNSNNLTMTNADAEDWQAGQIGGYSLDFNGTDEWLTVADPASGILDFGDGADFSISGWFNRDLFAADHTIVAKKNDQTTNQGYVLWVDNNGGTDYLNFEISDGTDTYAAAGATDLSATGWHHFTVVWNDGTGMYIYLDGRQDGSTTTSTSSVNSLANALAFRIGAETDGGLPFNGQLDDIRVYGRALSANEVLRLYQTTVPGSPVDTGLVGHWTFDGNDVNWGDTGLEIKDVSGKGNHGAVSGLTRSSVKIGKLGQGLSFNGTSDYVDAGSGSSLDDIQSQGGGGFSMSAWVYPRSYGSDTSGAGYIFSKGENFRLYIYDIGHFVFVADYIGNDFLYRAVAPSLVLNVWQFVTLVWDGGTSSTTSVRIYVNGQQKARDYGQDAIGDKVLDANENLVIGNSKYNDGTWDGSIDDVRIYNRVLTATEITDLYNQGR